MYWTATGATATTTITSITASPTTTSLSTLKEWSRTEKNLYTIQSKLK